MKRLLLALLIALFSASADASVIASTRPTFDRQYRPDAAETIECPRKPVVKTYFLWDDQAGVTYTWTGNDEPTLWLWGPAANDEISGIVIRRGGAYFAIDIDELISIAPSACELP